jgi:hypothetical protein
MGPIGGGVGSGSHRGGAALPGQSQRYDDTASPVRLTAKRALAAVRLIITTFIIAGAAKTGSRIRRPGAVWAAVRSGNLDEPSTAADPDMMA